MRQALIAGLTLYRLALSPYFGQHCRFLPSCSAYAVDALRAHGIARGGWLALRRVARCHPGCAGGYDPVPTDDPSRRCRHG